MTPRVRIPYPGLRAYAQSEIDLFFGREGCVNDMVDRLAASHFLAVLGASGSGKSSLVRTGLLDALELGLYASAGPLWYVADLHPGGSAIHNLAAALLGLRQSEADPFGLDSFAAFLRRGPRSVIEWVNEGNLPAGHNLLILVDQFEELFRYGDYAGREEAEAFTALLLESARGHPRIHVVITMRSEYLGACALIAGLAEKINSSLYLARRMTRRECQEAIEGPAGVVGFDIEPALVTKLLNDMSALAPWEADRETSQLQRLSRQADQLPLMQHALNRLWQLARSRADSARVTLTLQDYLDIGQLRGALDQHAAEVTARLSDAAKVAVEPVFRSLISGANLADAVRRPMRFADLCRIVAIEEPIVREVVDAFRSSDCNFLRPSEEQALTADTIVDISHESLIRQWEKLSEWFAAEAAANSLWSRLVYGVERHAAGQGELLGGLDLANALAWWDSKRPNREWASLYGGKYDDVAAFLQLSRQSAEARAQDEKNRSDKEKRWLKIRAATYAILAVSSLAAAVWAHYDNARLARTQTELVATNANLTRAKLEAESALNSAKNALLAERTANDRVMTAADRFVVGMANRLSVAPGIASDEVQSRLNEGRAYLDDLAAHNANPRLLKLMQAKFDAARANLLYGRGDFEDGLKLATRAEDSMRNGTEPLTRDELVEELEIDSLISDFYGYEALYKPAEGLAKARDMVRVADSLEEDQQGVVFLERAKAHFYLGYALGEKGKYQQAIDEASRCVKLLNRPGAPHTADRFFYEGRCHVILGVGISKVPNKMPESEHQTELAIQSFGNVPEGQETIPILLAHSRALANLGWDYMQKKDYAKARDLFKRSEELISLTSLDIKERPRLRAALVDRQTAVGRSFSDAGDHAGAVIWYQQARDVGFTDGKWGSYPELAANLDTALVDLTFSLGNLAWDRDKDILFKYEAAYRGRLQTLEYLLKHGKAPWCTGCEIADQQRLFYALTKFDSVRGEDRYKDAMALADSIVLQAKALLAKPPTERHALNARRAWFWTVYDMPYEPEDIPSATTDDEQLRRFDLTQEKLLEFRAAFPRSWFTEWRLGQVSYSRARLLARKVGRKDDALAAAETGARLFNRSSIQLLADWYATGSGPVARDAAKADRYKTILASRNWGLKRFTVPSKFKWLTNEPTYDSEFFIEDPSGKDDDFLARLTYQQEFIEGVELPDNVKETIAKLLKKATEEKSSFIDLTVAALAADADAADRVATTLKNDLLKDNNTQKAAEDLIQEWDKRDGPKAAKQGLSYMIDGNPGHNFDRALFEMSEKTLEKHRLDLTRMILDAIVDKNALKTPLLARVISLRGLIREDLKDFAGANADFATAVSLKPDDADLLKRQASAWIDQERNLPESIELLQRAEKLSPQDPNIRASLGWGEVKNREPEKGLVHLESAAAERPDDPEILAHLADTYRRLDRQDDAKAAFAKAAKLSKDSTLTAFIQHQQSLLSDAPVAGQH